ncbi:alpha/beta-hydrolase [Metschnikowia bicuspidata var. bicuspidata NRRL YB-4993]|uniref:Alpha/beta-hydrolase n=1 Tax=Metschnikowia bicuspidata var. bicuspidata NRRL YB-4993 TaxID=869754 RepID=A0A1A0HBV6_9ASCO|nr:alpha/beta-hydrolase [Metschnikowia bicuspidata var. bicuspidata NRRL YB-4993]OBA21465.1 alpha/beta-hydrolase [Metschnikowia bicuspidata var. bicuspidata NRRL YB-4993]
MSNLNPTVRTDLHGPVLTFFIVLSSAIGSFLFVCSVTLGANIYHLRDIFSGREKANRPKKENAVANYSPVEPYPNVDKLKITRDLRYYAQLLDLDLEEREITTKDGYVLVLHRLIDPKESPETRDAKTPIILQHGLLLCAGAYLAPGRNSLPYFFLHQGYDVWMGNNRCGFKPNHLTLKGNLMHNEHFWDWDVRHLAYYDLPCIIDNVLLHKPNHAKVYLVGHSQGCTQTLLLLRNEQLKEHHAKIEHFFALAPAAFPGRLFHERSFIKFIHSKSPRMYKMIFGNCCFLAMLTQLRNLMGTTMFFSTLSYQIFKYLFGWNIRNCYNHKKVIHVQFLFNASLVSAKLMSWWLSYSVEEGFLNQLQLKQAYKDRTTADFTPLNSRDETVPIQNEDLEKNMGEIDDAHDKDSKTLFPYKAEWFSTTEKTNIVPMMVFVGGEDYLVDGLRFASHMKHYERHFYSQPKNLEVVELAEYNHLDVIWALNCIGTIGMPIVERINAQSGDASVQD